MSSLILRQFTQGRMKSLLTEYTKIIGHKSPKLIDSVIPNLTTNLFKSTETFIEAVVNLDAELIQSTATHALQKKLLREVEEMKKRNVEVKTVPFASKLADALRKDKKEGEEEEDVKRFIISPYVIFGQEMKQRFEAAKPWENAAPVLGLNRFVVINPSEGLTWSKIKNDHVYGFHCHYQNINRGYQITENSKTTECPSREFVVTFQTDSINHQFFVADFNYIVKNDL